MPVLKVNPLQMQQVFNNILGNSMKYSIEGKPVHIRITVEKMKAGEMVANTDLREGWHISIEDNGIGFEQQYAKRIFEPFQRLHGKMDYPGTGIGLAICKKIVRYHRGVIEATGFPGKGSRFDIYLPAN
jgi:signal transduction histidine kinase